MIKDAIGNELQIGDTVHLQVGNNTWIVGIVAKMQQGGLSFIATPQKNNHQPVPTTPDVLLVQLAYALNGPAGTLHQDVFKIVAKNMVDQITESSVKM